MNQPNDDYYDYESPCVRTCVIDQHSKFCIGCGRTLHEISYWTRYTIEERQHILQQLPARLTVEPKIEPHIEPKLPSH